MIKFIIAGLPRSGTTWLSVFLSTDDCLCLHDPSATQTLEELSKWEGGISDTGLWYYSDWCKDHTDKFILIERNPKEVALALSKKNLPIVPDLFYDLYLEKTANKIIKFNTLFTEEGIRDLWEYVHPEKSFNKKKWLQLKEIYISPMIVERIYEESKTSTKI